MAVLLIDGFDLYNGTGTNTGLSAKWTAANGTTNASMVSGRFGGQRLQVVAANTNRTFSRTFTAQSAFAVGFAFKASLTATAPFFIMALYSGATTMLMLNVNADGSLTAARLNTLASSTPLGTSAAGVIVSGNEHYIECELVISDTVGVYNVYVDGSSVLSLSNQDTRNGTPTTCDTIYLGVNAGGGVGTFSFDDLYVASGSTKLGERRVETLYPTADVAQGFARSTGTANYALVDEPQVNGDTDYVQGSTVGDVDTYGFSDLTGSPTTIDAVQISAFAEKTDATTRSIALQVKSGATTDDGSNFSLTSLSYAKFERLLTQNPNGSVAWTTASVNALQGGPKVTV